MSKRALNTSGGGGNNTLLNYFARSPSTPKGGDKSLAKPATPASPLTSKQNTPTTSKSAKNIFDVQPKKSKKDDNPTDGDSSDEDIVKSTKKRKRICDSDSDRENESDNSQKMVVDQTKKPTKSISSDSNSNKKIKIDTKSTFEEKLKANIDESSSLSDIKDEPATNNDITDIPTVYTHNKLDFLKPDKIMDAKKRKPDHPDYDPTTLYVPNEYLDKLTPAMRQWWVIKSQNFDSVLFFKVGKFYELYHMDADVGVRELGFTYMRGEFAHSGFPEQSFDRMSSSLVERGYKVARIEQTETPDGMNERVKKMNRPTKFDKVVSREVCQIVSKGTQVFGQQIEISNEYESHFMLAIAEKTIANGYRYGVAFIDTSIGEFHIGEFDDDKQCSRLLTLIAHNTPVLVLYERGKISMQLQQIFKSMLSNTLREALLPETQFWSAGKTLKTMAEKYFSSKSNNEWPETIRITQDDGDHLGLTPNQNYQLALKSLGACLWYLTKCVIDLQIMEMARFNLYTPVDVSVDDLDQATAKIARRNFNKHMVLDSITLSNLKIVGSEKSLFNTLDQCCTKFGKRLLNYWICSPSCEKSVILERQEAIRELMDNPDILSQVRAKMATLPDLERQLAQIHSFGSKVRVTDHPDGRAVMFEQARYNKKKIQDFVATINGFNALVDIPAMFKICSSKLLKRLTQTAPQGEYPDFEKTIKFFKNGFDFEKALSTGVIAPGPGVDKEYDSIQERIAEIESNSKAYLIQQEKFFGCRLSYVGTDKKRFELEVPESAAKRADDRYSLEGQRKGAKPIRRFNTEETREFLREMLEAEEEIGNVLKDLMRRMFEKFSQEYHTWKSVIDSISTLDCLTALAVYGQNQNDFCFPEIVDNDNGPILEFEDSYYPCMTFFDDFIPNSITLGGGTTAPLALLTGPNMGGKSTLMRQVGLLAIMTQIGAPVPATRARISLIDRIFTRLGAQDDILAGQSTFLVELNETSAILKHATCNSLVLLDELGRGTATYDGTAIAAAVVDYLAQLKCRTLFSTHYHNLVDNFHADNRISLGHMACMVENEKEAEDADDPTQETVTFLYKYTDGACPKSYGFNAAKLAGLDKQIIKRGHYYSKKVELIALKRKLFSKVMSGGDVKDIKELISKVSKCTV